MLLPFSEILGGIIVSKGLIQAEPAVSKNVSTSTKGNKNENKIKAKLNNFI